MVIIGTFASTLVPLSCVAEVQPRDCEGPATSAAPASTAAATGSAVTTTGFTTDTSTLAMVTPSATVGGGSGVITTGTSSVSAFTGGAPVASFDTLGSTGVLVLAVLGALGWQY